MCLVFVNIINFFRSNVMNVKVTPLKINTSSRGLTEASISRTKRCHSSLNSDLSLSFHSRLNGVIQCTVRIREICPALAANTLPELNRWPLKPLFYLNWIQLASFLLLNLMHSLAAILLAVSRWHSFTIYNLIKVILCTYRK